MSETATRPRAHADSPPPDLFPGWRLDRWVSRYHFQDGMTVERWQARPHPESSAHVTTAAERSQFLFDTVAVTQAVLHDRAFEQWQAAAQWRQLWPHAGYAEVVALLESGGFIGIVQGLPGSARPVLAPPMTDGFRPADAGLGRALPERLVIPMLRKLLETAIFLLEKSRSLGPAPTTASLLDGVYFVPDLSAPRLKMVSPYVALPGSPDQHSRRHVGPLLALFGRLLLSGRYDDGAAALPLTQLRPGLTTQLPAWVAAMAADDGSASPRYWLEQFDASIADVKTDLVSNLYRPLPA